MEINLSDEDWRLLQQWLEDPTFIHWAEQTNEEDMAAWERYFNQHPEKWPMAKVGRSLIIGIPFREIPKDEQEGQVALTSLLDRLEGQKDAKAEAAISNTRDHVRRQWTVAASLTILIILCGGVYWQFFHNPQVLLATAYGQQFRTELPDGSTITLNANSSLKYRKLDPRKVILSGEAYFEVKKLPESREEFKVITEDLEITVQGTAFNVNTRNDHTKVFLAKGKVTLDVADSSGKEITMNPGDLVSYSKKSRELMENRPNASALELASWKEGALIFKDTPLTEALFQIEDIYGIQFIVQVEALKKEMISGGVPIKNLEVTLNTLREVYGLKMEKKGHRYFIEGME